MGQKVSRTDFEWVGSDEPHATRRKLILEAHPEIKQLMGVDPLFKWMVTACVIFQFVSFYVIGQTLENVWLIVLLSYCLGGPINHALMLAVHEISHNQAFGPTRPFANKVFGIFANLPLGVPMSISFKKYHLEHHRYQGDDVLDTDIPSKFEARYFTNTFMKFIWVILQPFFYTLRPLFVHPKQPSMWELVNLIVQVAVNYLVIQFCGWKMVLYMISGSVLAMGLHPVAGHFISEHYIMFKSDEPNLEKLSPEDRSKAVYTDKRGKLIIPETCSYYGPLNYITFWVGYHVEHHDFPSIPGRRLPLVRKIAPEFYNHLEHHTSWSKVIYQYIMDPTVGPYARVKRPHRKANAQSESYKSTNGATANGDSLGTRKSHSE